MRDPDLLAAFEATRYRVRLRTGAVDLSIGRHDPAQAARLSQQLPASRHWVLITSDHPGAGPQGATARRQARRDLRDDLERRGYAWAPTAHRDPRKTWPTERGYCVPDLPPSVADELMRTYGQLAIVIWPCGSVPILRWAEDLAGGAVTDTAGSQAEGR